MSVNTEKLKELFEKAKEVSKNSYSPYSEFPVGAAILVDDDLIFCGTNVENRSYGLTNCAERSAVFSAVSSGYKKIYAIAIVAPKADYPVGPCGACRQVMVELLDENCPIILAYEENKSYETTVKDLFPLMFTSEDLEND